MLFYGGLKMTYQVLWGVNNEGGPTVLDHFLGPVRRVR